MTSITLICSCHPPPLSLCGSLQSFAQCPFLPQLKHFPLPGFFALMAPFPPLWFFLGLPLHFPLVWTTSRSIGWGQVSFCCAGWDLERLFQLDLYVAPFLSRFLSSMRSSISWVTRIICSNVGGLSPLYKS